MKQELQSFFSREKIKYFSAISLSDCRIINPRLLEKTKVNLSGSALLFLVPYYGGEGKNISAYAVSRDYHKYFGQLFDKLCPLLGALYPGYEFFGFSDHSPISEVNAAACCGLGVVGDNHLLINEKYSSFVFIGEVISSLPAECYGIESTVSHPGGCEHCGACAAACPTGALMGGSVCLSALTQKKGTLTDDEAKIIIKNKSAWGCDTCQNVCPHTKRAKKDNSIYTGIDYFLTDRIGEPDEAIIRTMPDDEFLCRAYSWRGRETICRNLHLIEQNCKDINPG